MRASSNTRSHVCHSRTSSTAELNQSSRIESCSEPGLHQSSENYFWPFLSKRDEKWAFWPEDDDDDANNANNANNADTDDDDDADDDDDDADDDDDDADDDDADAKDVVQRLSRCGSETRSDQKSLFY